MSGAAAGAGALAAPPGPPVRGGGDGDVKGMGGGSAGAGERSAPYKPPGFCTKCWRKLCPFCCAPSLEEMQKEKEKEQRMLAKKREDEAALALVKKEEKPKPTSFYFKLDKISATFEAATNNVFVEFEVGGQMLERETEQMVTSTVKKKRVGKNGETTEIEATKTSYKKATQVKRPPAARFFTRYRSNVKAKTPTPWPQEFVGYWDGTYRDLEVEYLTIRVWGRNQWGVNKMLGIATEPMEEIARTKMDRTVYVFVFDPTGQKPKELGCTLSFKFELQEKYEFFIDFRDWEVVSSAQDQADWEDVDVDTGEIDTGSYRRLTFQLERSRASIFDDCKLQALKCVCFGCGLYRKSGDECVLPILHGSSRAKTGSLLYPGTRSWLEDETLTLTLSQTLCYKLCKACFCLKYIFPCLYKYELSKQKVNLQGILDYGHIMTDMTVQRHVSCTSVLCPCCFKKEFETVKLKGAVACAQLPLHRQLGNVDPAGGSAWLNLQAGETYLVVKVLRAKGLYSLGEFKEQLNPSVIVEFSGLRKQTRTIGGQSDPVWDDDVFFKIPDRRVNFCQENCGCTCYGLCTSTRPQVPKEFKHWGDYCMNVIQLSVWDNDGLSKNPLGYCSVSFRDVWYGRDREKLYRSFNGTNDKVKRPVYEGKFPLKTPSDGSVRTGPKKPNELIEERNPTRYIEFECYFERSDNQVIVQESRAKGETDDPANQANNKKQNAAGAGSSGGAADFKSTDGLDGGNGELTSASIHRAMEYWNLTISLVPDRQKRYMTIYGRDEYTGQFHFLPRFVKPMNPPSDIQRYDQLLYYVYAIETIKKQTKKPDVASLGNDEPWVWADPFFFLEKRKGDVKDHALLLCNFLLGLKREAYVCIGSACSMSGREEPHVWVMTLEPSFEECRTLAAQNKPVPERVVRFWETTNGRAYCLRGRFAPETVGLGAAAAAGDAAAAGAAKDDDDEDDDVAVSGAAKGVDKNGEDLGPNAAKNLEAVKLLDRLSKKYSDKVKALTGDEVDGKSAAANNKVDEKYGGGSKERAAREKAEREAKEQAERDKEELTAERERSDDEASLVDSAYPMAAVSAAAAAGAVVGPSGALILPKAGVKVSGSESLFDSKLKSRVELERQTLEHQRQLQKPFKDENSSEAMRAGARATPYWSIDIVFNHKCLYANLQPRDPEVVKYNLRDPRRWHRFGRKDWTQYFKLSRLSSFYPDKALVSLKVSAKETDSLERSITERVKESIRVHRSYHCSLDTVFLDQFGFQHRSESASEYVQLRLEFEAKYGERDRELHELQNEKESAEVGTPEDRKPNEVAKQEEKRASWRALIIKSLARGYTYSEKLFHFKHTDANRISDVVLDKCQVKGNFNDKERAKRDILEIDDQRGPKFVVGVKITQMPASISPVRVFVAVIAKDGTAIDL